MRKDTLRENLSSQVSSFGQESFVNGFTEEENIVRGLGESNIRPFEEEERVKSGTTGAQDVHSHRLTEANIEKIVKSIPAREKAEFEARKKQKIHTICKYCRERISPARRKAKPHAVTCVTCQDQQEEKKDLLHPRRRRAPRSS